MTLFAVLAVLAVLAVPAWAAAGTLTLHPSGFGEHSYSAWKAHQGLPDSSGNDSQALYFQKNTFTETNAAGIAVFKGYEGLPGNGLTGLSFWWRTDGHCGAGAPRFNVYVRPTGGGPTQTIFIGCQGMAPTGRTAPGPNGTLYEERAIAGPVVPA